MPQCNLKFVIYENYTIKVSKKNLQAHSYILICQIFNYTTKLFHSGYKAPHHQLDSKKLICLH